MKLLASKGANINALDKNGETPLLRAVSNGLVDVVMTLIR